MSNLTPQKRKSSLPLEQKLKVYEFEVDENEPKTKQKKKRGPKPGVKKGKRAVVSKKVGVKSPIKTETNTKQPTKLKKALVSSVKNEIQKEVLSTKNSSSPLFENKRRPNEEGLKRVSSRKQMANMTENSNLKNKIQTNGPRILSEINRSPLAKEKSSVIQNENEVLSELDQKENLIQPELNKETSRRTYNRKILTPKKRKSKVKDIDKTSIKGNEKPYISSSTPIRNENTFYNTVEVPVLFHNAQDASPNKSIAKVPSYQKTSFSAMSDDENINKSITEDNAVDKSVTKVTCNQKTSFSAMSDDGNINKSVTEDNAADHLLQPSFRSIDGPSRLSFRQNSSYDYEINASTPVKYNNNNTCNSSVDNYFGFDELEEFEEPAVSPIKTNDDCLSTHSGARIPPYKAFKKVNTPEKKNDIPVKQVIRMLKYGDDYDKSLDSGDKSSSASNSPPLIFNDLEERDEDNKILKEDSTLINPAALPKAGTRVPRRSYERPAYLRKKNKSFEEEQSSDEEIHEKTVKPKKKHGPSKKEQDEMQKWIKAFNSQCQEIEKFDLVVE